MAHNIIRYKLSSMKKTINLMSRINLSSKSQRMSFHTSWILDVKGREVLMPSLSPTMETGTIVKWLKKEGETIQPGDAIADIQTGKAVMTFEMEEESILAKVVVPEGTKDIKVGTLIALTVETDEDWKSVEMPDNAESQSSASPSQPETENAPVEDVPGQINVVMPALSPTMTSGTIVKWLKNEGDEIAPGDAIADIQTDKAVMTFEMDEEGILAKILVKEGSQVDVGQLIAVTVEKGMDWKSVVAPQPSQVQKKPSVSEAAESSASSGTTSAQAISGQVYGLAVKRLLEEYNLKAESIQGSGRNKRLLKGDVLSYIQSNNVQKVTPDLAGKPSKAAPQSDSTTKLQTLPPPKSGPSTYRDQEVSNIRAVIAKRLGESKRSIPHSYATIDISIDKLSNSRNDLKARNMKVSINDYIIKAVAHALLQCPDVNSLYKDNQVVRMQNVDISVAVSTPTGLITPIIFNPCSKSLTDISNEVKTLAGKAREGTLKPNEFQGGTFTISNLGMFGIKEFSAIINPPQTAILAIGTSQDILDNSLKKSSLMNTTLSYDSRAIDEDQAANFLTTLKSILEEPSVLTITPGQQAFRHRREQ